MYVARFSYNIMPVDREQAIQLLRQEVEAAQSQDLKARMLIPLTRPPGGAALQYEVVLPDLGSFESFRDQGMGGEDETHTWMRDLSAILLEPPTVELLRIADNGEKPNSGQQGLIGGTPHQV